MRLILVDYLNGFVIVSGLEVLRDHEYPDPGGKYDQCK